MTPQGGSEQWMPNGFPPPSFVVETERTRTFAGPRGRWLAAAGILGALLLIAGIALIANQGDDGQTALNTGSSTTAVGEFTPTFPPSTALDPTATIPNATVPPGGAGGAPSATVPGGSPGTTSAGGGPAPGPTAAPPPGAAPGVLTPSTGTVALPKIDASVGPATGTFGLRNTGASPLDYATRSNFGGLTVDAPSGSIAPGASVNLTVTLNGAAASEGPFNGQLVFDSPAGGRTVNVTSLIGRPPTITDSGDAAAQCPAESDTNPTACSKQIKPTSNAGGPCDGPWRYKVVVSDQSNLKAVRADRDLDIELKNNGVANGPQGTWQSDEQPRLQQGTTLTFTIEAIDQFDFVRRSTERKVKCP